MNILLNSEKKSLVVFKNEKFAEKEINCPFANYKKVSLEKIVTEGHWKKVWNQTNSDFLRIKKIQKILQICYIFGKVEA